MSGPSAYWYLTRGTGVVALLLAGIVHAQELPLPARNPHAAPTSAVLGVAPRAAESMQVDEHALNLKLSARNAELKRQNAELAGQVGSLTASLAEFTSKGGSAVHAYCEDTPSASLGLSRNTAGVQSDCTASGNLCEPVSGLCRTTCQTTAMCAPGWVCDTGPQQCVHPAGG